MSEVVPLSLEDILYLHDRMLQKFGGASGVIDQGGLLSAVARPFSGIADHEF